MKMTKKTFKSNPKRLSISTSPKKELEYDNDFFKWTKTQVNLLKKRSLDKLDIDNLIEEIESLGRNDKRTLRSQANRLLMHLLKQKYQPEGQGNSNSWNSSILNATREIKYLLEDSPSLKNELRKMYPKAYEDARQDASIETCLDIKNFPKECPWAIEDLFPDLYPKEIKNQRKKST
jgi:Domain of unknown function DUF29